MEYAGDRGDTKQGWPFLEKSHDFYEWVDSNLYMLGISNIARNADVWIVCLENAAVAVAVLGNSKRWVCILR